MPRIEAGLRTNVQVVRRMRGMSEWLERSGRRRSERPREEEVHRLRQGVQWHLAPLQHMSSEAGTYVQWLRQDVYGHGAPLSRLP